jgi:hypothetical protein
MGVRSLAFDRFRNLFVSALGTGDGDFILKYAPFTHVGPRIKKRLGFGWLRHCGVLSRASERFSVELFDTVIVKRTVRLRLSEAVETAVAFDRCVLHRAKRRC